MNDSAFICIACLAAWCLYQRHAIQVVNKDLSDIAFKLIVARRDIAKLQGFTEEQPSIYHRHTNYRNN